MVADVAESVGVVLEGDGDEAGVEGDLHHPVGHHAVDLVAVRLFGADDVEAVGQLVHHAGDGVFGYHELRSGLRPRWEDMDMDAGLHQNVRRAIGY